MCSIHRQTIFRSQVMQEYLHTTKRSLAMQEELLISFMANDNTIKPGASAVNRSCDTMFSNFWPSPIAHFPAYLGFQCCRVSEVEGGSRCRILARVILSPRETATWLRLPATLKRRREWLFGRLAAKDAVRLFLKEQHGLELCPIDIEISADEHGRPIVSGEVVDNFGSRLSISIAHSEGEAVAIAGECGHHPGVGVDVEHVDQNCDGLARIALTESERTLVYRIRSWRRREWLLRIWCAKEAVAKALGRGMAGCPLNLVVKDVEIETGRLAVGLAGKLAHQLSTYAGRHFTAYTGCEGSLVFASSLIN